MNKDNNLEIRNFLFELNWGAHNNRSIGTGWTHKQDAFKAIADWALDVLGLQLVVKNEDVPCDCNKPCCKGSTKNIWFEIDKKEDDKSTQ